MSHRRSLTLAVMIIASCLGSPREAAAQRCVIAEVEVPPVSVRLGSRATLIVFFRDRNGIPCDEPPYTATSSNASVARIEGTRGNYEVVGGAVGQALINVRTGTGRTLKTGSGPVAVSAADVTVPNAVDTIRQPPPDTATLTGSERACRGSFCATLGYQPVGSGPPVGIEVSPRELLMLPGEVRRLTYRTASATGANAERLPLQFHLSPATTTVAAVDSIGVVTARDTGSATINVTAANRGGIVPDGVRVVVRADSISFARRSISMAPQSVDTVRLRVPAQNRNLEGRMFRFRSSDSSVVRVNLYDPYLVSVGPGRAIITAEPANPVLPTVQLPVIVFQPVRAIQMADTSLTLAIRQSRTVTMRPVAADSSYVSGAPIEVRGLDPSKATATYDSVAGAFTLTGVSSGELAITMRVQNGRDSSTAVERTLRIRVVAGGLQLSTTRVGLAPSERVPFTIALLDDARRPLAGVDPQARWSTSDSAVARVDNGAIVAGGVGKATLTARTPWDSTASIEVYVVPAMLVVKQRLGAWNLFGRTNTGSWNQITTDSLIEGFPAYSPDLTRIAFTLTPTGRPAELWIANADGSNPQKLFGSDSGSVRRPSFVRGTDQIVFELNYSATGSSQVFMVGTDGRNARQLQLGPAGAYAGFPSVSPDGRRILYVSLRDMGGQRSYDVFLANIDGSNEQRKTTYVRTDDSPAWHPDGNSFFFLREEGDARRPAKRVWQFDMRSDSAIAVSPATMYVQAFSVSGDGSLLAVNEIVPPASDVRLQLLTLSNGSATLVPLDAGERLQQTAPAMRPASPAPAATPPRP